MDAVTVLTEVAAQVSVCEACELHSTRKKSVPGEGPDNAEIMFIGEGPGFFENEQGRPFVGQAGKFLDELLAKAGLARSKVFITNVVKCRPPNNRDPEPAELTACSVFLDRQIEAINPLVIVTLGRFSMAKFMPTARISTVHGQASWINGRLVVAMYHPAAALHQPNLKPVVEQDFSHLAAHIDNARKAAARTRAPEPAAQETPPTDQATQLSLF